MSELTKQGGVETIHLPDGREVYLAGSVPQGLKVDFVDWMEARARKRIFQLRKKGELEEDEYKESLRSVNESVAANLLGWGTDAWEASFRSMPGQIKMFALLARWAEPYPDGRPRNDPCPDESGFLALYQDKDVAIQLGEALQRILNSSPNFIEPPMEGTG